MFDSLYHYPSVLARHRDGPSAEDRDRFLARCAEQGAAQTTLLGLAPELLVVARRIDVSGTRTIPLGEVQTAADRWVGYQRRHHRIRSSRCSRERFIQTATALATLPGPATGTGTGALRICGASCRIRPIFA